MAVVIVALANGRRIPFDVDLGGAGPACFVLGIRKCGSTLLNLLCRRLAALNNRRYLSVETFFEENVIERIYLNDPALGAMLHDGNVYGGFRMMPAALTDHPIFREGRKILLVRDPRDALVSEYFSMAYSHPVPTPTDSGSPVTDMMQMLRQRALEVEIDTLVVERAPQMRKAFLDYVAVARLAGTVLLRYEEYIFRKPEMVRLIAKQFGWTVDSSQIEQIMVEADQRPATEDPTAFVRRVTPGDHRIKLRPATITSLNQILKPAMEAFGYQAIK
jgi:Sulfotransferase domain